jgi:hypothetical protein
MNLKSSPKIRDAFPAWWREWRPDRGIRADNVHHPEQGGLHDAES